MPLKIRIFIFTSMKAISGPSLYFIRFPQSFISLIRIYFHHHKLFRKITTCFMIQNDIQIYSNLIFVKFINHLLQFIFRPVFSPHSSFLFKLTQIIQIISSISFILLFICFICRWYPDRCHTNFM